MSTPASELVAIARLNGDFQKNYGKLLGAVLYLRSISATRTRVSLWSGLLFALLSCLARRAGPSVAQRQMDQLAETMSRNFSGNSGGLSSR